MDIIKAPNDETEINVAERYLTVHLFHNDSCDPSYDPPGFRSVWDDTIRVPDNDVWKMTDSSVQARTFGSHRYNSQSRTHGRGVIDLS